MAQIQYTRLSLDEREFIYKSLAEGKWQSTIAAELNRDPSTISREIRRCGMNRKTYRPSVAQKHFGQESIKRRRKYKLIANHQLTRVVEEKLKQKWSPEQISGVLKKDNANFPEKQISHESIYRYIYFTEDTEHRELLISCLRQSRKRRRPRRRNKTKRTTIRNLVSIWERPKEVEFREVPGDWEGDLIIGKDHRSAIGTLVERTTRFVIMVPFEGSHTSREVVLGFAAALGILPAHMKRSLTYDRGTEMAGHQWFTEITGIPVYFADPYSPWQRGTNENTNGLIRQYFPKKTDFRGIDDQQYISVATDLNNRPRKILDYSSPDQMFKWLLRSPEKTVNDFYRVHYEWAI